MDITANLPPSGQTSNTRPLNAAHIHHPDFSKGVRLEELNVLLKQAVMIRRLKKHVLVQLPAKRRQIISLQLKRSDIVSAMNLRNAVKSNASGNDNAEEEPSEVSDQLGDSGGCHRSLRMLSEQEIGIAKLSGFLEWLSMHPIFAESDGADNPELSLSSHKMIIFAHHHKVLDGVQVRNSVVSIYCILVGNQ
ncbi:DNA helicase [Sarracenia purpurea var. burkii]